MKRTITLICLITIFNISQSIAQNTWEAMGAEGLGASTEDVRAIAVDPNGNIFAGGTFTNAGDNNDINYIAKWNSSTSKWEKMATGINGPVYSIGVKTASDIYVGGLFTDAGGVAVSNIARWNGSAWSAIGSGFNGKVLCVTVPGSGVVYVGGEFGVSGATTVSHIAKLSGGNWVAMGAGIPSNVNAIVEHSGSVFAGCDLGSNPSPVMKFDGTNWIGVSGISGGKVSALASYSGFLYAGGTFSQPAFACAKWDGTNWGTVITNFASTHRVNVLFTRPNALYIGGNFTGIGVNSPNYIARILGTNQPILSFTNSSELTNGGEVFGIGMQAGHIVTGGKFTTPSPSTFNVSRTSGTISVDELNNLVVDQTLYPNPAHGKTTLTVNTVSPLMNSDVKIFDSQSKLVQVEVQSVIENNKVTYEIDLSNVSAGHYYYVLTEEGQPVTSNIFIVE